MQWKCARVYELRSSLCLDIGDSDRALKLRPVHIQYKALTGGGVRITGEVTVSALSSPYLSMLRDCKCLVRCQVSVCLSQFPWLKSGGTRARLLEFRITPSDQASRSVRPASAESTSSSMQTAFTGALTPSMVAGGINPGPTAQNPV